MWNGCKFWGHLALAIKNRGYIKSVPRRGLMKLKPAQHPGSVYIVATATR